MQTPSFDGEKAQEHPLVEITVYLSDEGSHEQVERAVEQFLADAGIAIETREEPLFGSYFRRLWARAVRASRSPLASEAAKVVTQKIEAQFVTEQNAKNTEILLRSLAPVLSSLQSTKDAVVRVGAVLIVKTDWTVTVHELTSAQLLELSHRPHLAMSPREITERLELVSRETTPTPNAHQPEPAADPLA